MEAEDLTRLLKKAELFPALYWADQWLQFASYGEIRDLVKEAPERLREHVVLLLEDVLSQWPTVRWGLPVLFRWSDPQGGDLPLPLPEHSAPDPSITRMSWVSLNTMRDRRPYGSPTENLCVSSGGVHCAILMCQTASQLPPTISDEWFGELFADSLKPGCDLRISSRLVLPLPSAVEAGAALLSAASTGGKQVDTPRVFLDNETWAFALEAGVEWRNTLQSERHQD
jgi:hypothetical protein